ncbi:MAG: hypothetical protein AAB414_04295 [Patescibacteria group bacterium]
MGKRKKIDVILFERFLEENLFNLYLALKNKTYQHCSASLYFTQD